MKMDKRQKIFFKFLFFTFVLSSILYIYINNQYQKYDVGTPEHKSEELNEIQSWITFDGDWSSYVDAGIIDDFGGMLETTNVTVSFWVNYTNVSEVWMPFGVQNDHSGSSFSAYLNGNVSEASPFHLAGTVNQITFNLRDEFSKYLRVATSGNINISDGEWHHIALTAKPNAKHAAIYIDGRNQPIDSNIISNITHYDFHDFEGFLAVGANNMEGKIEQTLPGDLDEFRIYQTSLTSKEIFSIYSKGRKSIINVLGNPNDNTLILYYPFNKNEEMIAYDFSGKGHNGIIHNATFSYLPNINISEKSI